MKKAQGKKGVAAIFNSEESLVKAAEACSQAGLKKFDAIAPYPVHGLEEACRIQRSWIPYVTFSAGAVGLLVGLFITWWTSAVNWPINVGGKPFFSLPAFIPIMFELTILFAALSSVGALLYACGLPKVDPPVIDPALTCHKFGIFVPEDESGFEETRITQMLKSLGAAEVRRAEF